MALNPKVPHTHFTQSPGNSTVSFHHYNLSLFWNEVLNKNGDRPALSYSEQTIPYSELGCMVEKLADTLLGFGLQQGDVIAIAHTKKPLSYALMLASLRIGIPYVCIDVDSPKERNHKILEASEPSLLCFDNAHISKKMQLLAEKIKCKSFFLDENTLPSSVSKVRLVLQNAMASKVDGSCIAYIMFTSGSTGTPKGVAVTHDNVLHFIAWSQQRFRISPSENFANLSPMYFDNSVFDFYSALFSGACLSPISKELLSSPYELVPYVSRMGCTIWFSVPSLLMYLMTMKALSKESLSGIKYIAFGGEGYPKPELLKLYTLFSNRSQLINVYGPTECTCICSAYRITEKDFDEMIGLPPLGELNQNFDYCIVDEEGSETNTGELCLIGPNVASGYYNDKDLTEKSFATLSEKKRFMKRIYRTGDIVSKKDGLLWYLGRVDNQIKHMGYRIELEEIENAIAQHKDVDQAAVIYMRSQTTHGIIVAFVASRELIEETDIIEETRELLPSYMIPSKVKFLKCLPKNRNGKIDRIELHNMI